MRRFDPENPEMMDRPQPVTVALRRDLANLRHLNRWFGAWRILRHWARPVFRRGRVLRIVDLCTGSGDLPIFLVQMARQAGCSLHVDAVDLHASTLAIAREHCAAWPEITIHEGDARFWEPPVKPDYVLCSLALHHFTEVDAVHILRRMAGMAKAGVLIADLERAWWATIGIYAASLFYREPMTVEDMRRSVRAAFSRAEMEAFTAVAGWINPTSKRFFYGRQAVWFQRLPIPK